MKRNSSNGHQDDKDDDLCADCYSDHLSDDCLEFFIPLENLSLIWRRHHCR